MSKAELMERIVNRILVPYEQPFLDGVGLEPITIDDAQSLLGDYRCDDELIGEPDFSIPDETTPELLMEVYNALTMKWRC